MKIKVFSDIHLDHRFSAVDNSFYPGKGDILILAGDILAVRYFKTNGDMNAYYKEFLQVCSNNFEHVLYVIGNHEAYGYNYEGAFNTLKKNVPSNFHILENETLKIGDWNFIGSTFWTNFRNENPIEMMEAECMMNDYKLIRIGSNYRKLRATDVVKFYNNSRDYLLSQLETLKDNVFVITHHAPSYRSIHERFKSSACNSAYCNNLDGMIENHPQIKYWVHGHVHSPFNYMIEQCNVICNPVGYPREDVVYDPNLYIKL